MIDRRFFLTLALASAVTTSVGALSIGVAHAETDPKVTVQGFYDVLLDCMQHGKELGFDGRFQKLAPAIGQAFDVPIMARIAVGPAWTAMPADKKSAVLEVFTRYMVTTYASRFKSFNGEKFVVGDLTQPAADRKLVTTQLIRPDGDPVQLNYVFRQGDSGWKIIDIYLSGTISEMARMRSDFSETLRTGGADALIAILEKKISELKADA
ncbi:MAG TPA: ABC transporter substrate-binding protein [Dongiaceae bacterium]